MMMALVVPCLGGREVTRAKKLMSALMRGHGRVPFRPIPRRVAFWSEGGVVVVAAADADATRIGVVATIKVRGREEGIEWVVGGGILDFGFWIFDLSV